VIIGDGACGKTSLLSVFTLGYFPTVRSHDAGCCQILFPRNCRLMSTCFCSIMSVPPSPNVNNGTAVSY
jgi:GTPase SAR1 family protein